MFKSDESMLQAPVLEVDDLTVRFGGLTAVNGLSFSIQPGEIVGFIGPNGAGKTTLMNAISRLVESTGQINFRNQSIDRVAPHKLRGLGLARSFQKPELDLTITVGENIAAGLAYRRNYGLWSAGLRLPAMRRKEAAIQQATTGAGDEFQVREWLSQRTGGAPNGIRKITDVARATIGQPVLVLLDEPFAGLNADEKQRLTGFLSSKRSEQGMTILVIDHDVDLMVDFCDKLFAMSQGELTVSGLPSEVVQDPSVMSSYLGISSDIESS